MLVGTIAVFTLVLIIPHYWVKMSKTLPNACELWGFPSGWCQQATVNTGSHSFQILQIFLSLALDSFYWLVACWIPKGNPLYSVLHASTLGCPTCTCLPAISVSALSQLMEYSKLQLGSSPSHMETLSKMDTRILTGLMPFISHFFRDCCASLHDIQYLGNCCFFFWFFFPDRRVNPGPIILS